MDSYNQQQHRSQQQQHQQYQQHQQHQQQQQTIGQQSDQRENITPQHVTNVPTYTPPPLPNVDQGIIKQDVRQNTPEQ